MLRKRYQQGHTFQEHIAAAKKNRELWVALAGRAQVPADLLARAAALPGRWYLLALSEDWCGDAVNTLPAVAALADAAPNLELRILERDRNPDLMDAHLTNGARAIPIVMILDERFHELASWGPRPRELQAWALGEGKALTPEDRYRQVRTWYARDRGRTTLEEIVTLLESAAARREAA